MNFIFPVALAELEDGEPILAVPHWHSMFFLSLFLHQVLCYPIVTFLILGFL